MSLDHGKRMMIQDDHDLSTFSLFALSETHAEPSFANMQDRLCTEKAVLIEDGRTLAENHELRRKKHNHFGRLLPFFILFLIVGFNIQRRTVESWILPSSKEPVCKQFGASSPPSHPADENHERIFSEQYQNHSVSLLSGLVQIPSESYDDEGKVGEDPRWDVFYKIPTYLEQAFPLLSEKLTLTKVNTHALLYTWAGTDPNLKPSMLMAHQDVVPVNPETASEWTHPPYSGYFDGTKLWGRGSVDCKDTLIATLEAVTLLLEKDFVPRRTIILAFGFDEESKGTEGAGSLADYLYGIYGSDGIAFIVDEGGLGVGEMFGGAFALPGTSEKGYLDVTVSLHTPGGHSSIPPDHTGIGMLAQAITALESTPFSPSLSLESPAFSLLQCIAENGSLPKGLKKYVKAGSQPGPKGEKNRQELAKKYAALGREERYLVQTSQAIDIVSGGVKVNALPETSSFVANYRISVDESVPFVQDHISRQLSPVAKKHGLGLTVFGKDIISKSLSSNGQLVVKGGNDLAPAPVSPLSAPAWKMLSSTIQHAFKSKFPDGLTVAPCVMYGNTDTHFYGALNLTRNVYRFTPSNPKGDKYIHTVDEHLVFSEHPQSVWFYHELLRNADAAALD